MLTETESPGVLRRVVRGPLDAAATPHGIDRYVELVAPTWSTTEVRGRVVEVRRQTASTVTLTIEANRNWRGFQAGQYTQLAIEIDGVRHTRCYSMANAATDLGTSRDRRLELTVKAQAGGLVGNYLVSQVRPGMIVGLSPAQGDFVLPPERPEQLLLVSGGSGITPVMAILRTLCAEAHAGQVTFLHYCLTRAELTYSSELAALASSHPNVRVVKVFVDEPGAGDADGLISAAQLDQICPEWRHTETYLCGPGPLTSAAAAIYEDACVSGRLHTEAFTLAQFVAEAGPVGGTVRFAGSDAAVESDGRTLLEQAEANGLRPASGCRMGICHTCVRPLLSGTVRNVVSGELTPATGDEIRICVSAPVGDVSVDL